MKHLKVFDEPYSKMMLDYFLKRADEILWRERPIRSIATLERRKKRLRRQLWKLLTPPAKPLPSPRIQIVGRTEKEDYAVEKIVFEVFKKLYGTALLYLPRKADFPAPGILCVHGHWKNAKHEPVVQSRCICLAKRGYVVLNLDKVGYGEREPQGHSHTHYLYLAGSCLQGMLIRENIAMLDYLISRPEVDGERIGLTGCSGGGNQTMYLAALEERIKVAVPVCSVNTYTDQLFRGIGCSCEGIPSALALMEEYDILSLVAPRPLLVISGIKDVGFPILGTRKCVSRLREIYQLYGAPEKLKSVEFYEGHGYSRAMREEMYRWMDRWLMGKPDEPAPEPEHEVEDLESPVIRCFPVGEFPADTETVYGLFRKRTRRLPPLRARDFQTARQWEEKKRELRERLLGIWGGFPERCELRPQHVESGEHDGVHIEKLWFKSEEDIAIPALFAKPVSERRERKPTVVIFHPEGKENAIASAALKRHLRDGKFAIAIDYRFQGETDTDGDQRVQEGKARGIPTCCRNSIIIGKHILGMLVYDVMRTVDYLLTRDDVDPNQIEVHGLGEDGMLAIFAGAVDDRISRVISTGAPVTLKPEKEIKFSMKFFTPGLLKVVDLEHAAAMIAPRFVRIEEPQSGDGRALSADEAASAFAFARAVFALYGKSENLEIIVE